MLINNIDESWFPVINLIYQEPLKTLNEQILNNVSFQPKKNHIFEVFKTPLQDIKVVILGIEPNVQPHMSKGLAILDSPGSILRVIEKELIFNGYDKAHFDTWTQQGVFLLNTALTVQTGMSNSHRKYWDAFTKRIISFISHNQPCIWLVWGHNSRKYLQFIKPNALIVDSYSEDTIDDIPINSDWNYIFTGPHPAIEANYFGLEQQYYSFFNRKQFLYSNKILMNTKSSKINW